MIDANVFECRFGPGRFTKISKRTTLRNTWTCGHVNEEPTFTLLTNEQLATRASGDVESTSGSNEPSLTRRLTGPPNEQGAVYSYPSPFAGAERCDGTSVVGPRLFYRRPRT